MARPKLGNSESKRLQMVITEDELQAIDDWRFENRVENRSEAIRRLCQMALHSQHIVYESLADLDKAAEKAMNVGDQAAEQILSDADPELIFEALFNSIGELYRDIYTIRNNLTNTTVVEGMASNPDLQHLNLDDRFKAAWKYLDTVKKWKSADAKK